MSINGITDVVKLDKAKGHLRFGDDGERIKSSKGGKKFTKLILGGRTVKIRNIEDVIVVVWGV